MEVFQALKNSIIDIVLLSPNYKNSEYCLNEAGIICFKEKTEKIIIAFPEMDNPKAGFLDTSYNQLRIDNIDFVDSFIQKVDELLSKYELASLDEWNKDNVHRRFKSDIKKYMAQLPILENLIINMNGFDEVKNRIEEARNIINKLSQKKVRIYIDNKGIFYRVFFGKFV